jgi:hypothetical protein
MTAVDPQRLAREIESLDTVLDDPKSLRSRVIALLDIYADRTRRTGAGANPERTPWSFDVPSPILRSLKLYLQEKLVSKTKLAWEITDELWHAGYRETQLLATNVLMLCSDPKVAEWVEEHAVESVDNATMATLARDGLSGWRQSAPQDFITATSRWLQDEKAMIRAFSLYGLGAAVRDPAFEDLPAVFSLLHDFTQPTRGDSRRALLELVRALANRSPAETTHFLLEGLKRGGTHAERLARSVLEILPKAQRTAIQQALSG